MITLLIGAALAVQAPSDALCAAAYALQAQHMQETGELPRSSADPRTLTPGQKTAMAASRRLLSQGVTWMAVATRTPDGRREADAAFRTLARAPVAADAAYAACSVIAVEDRLPALAAPPAPLDGDGDGACADAVGAFFAAMRACATLDALRAQAREVQSKLEQGSLTCRSKDQARIAWSQIGSAAAGADSQGQRLRCSVQ